MGHVRSLPNKMDELAALTRHQREYQECSLLLFTEMWLTALTPDTAAELDGFTLLRADRSKESGKRKGGGLAVCLKEKRRAFVSGNKEELKSVQRELRRMIRKGKNSYRRKMEHQLQQNNICGVWKGLKTISGFKEPKSQPVGDQGWANDLNLFFNRFDQASAPPPAQSPLLQPPSRSVPPVHCSSCAPSPSLMTFSSHPPNTSSSHCPVPLPLINTSLLQPAPSHHTRSAVWDFWVHIQPEPGSWGECHSSGRRPAFVPVPKTPHPKELNSYRPVALTSHLMKTLERLVLAHLRPLVSSFMDPLQFAYQPDIGVDDAVIYLLHTSLTHLEKAGSTVRIMFFDFSSAFNTIQPRLLWDKLQLAGVDHHLTTWILDYLTHRPQFVRVQGFESDRLLCSTTGAPQGTVLAPFLFTLYTADFSYNTPSYHFQKFSDDSAVVGLITDGDDREYRGLIQDFADWEADIDTVKSYYKYLGVHLNDSLDCPCQEGQQQTVPAQEAEVFWSAGTTPLRTFYDSVVASAIFYGIVCWASSITDRDRRRMDRLVRRASSVLGCSPLDSVEVVGNRAG
ncbi:hypothetical protein L3Q82_011581 [Scortum barcoo]|uniref:Uncharacterized protein n=1 Tax=Scortum barcoo TaxID=214431 RepID=A0ACB8W750_9TELE|nr:hypothetical protein L3Q82_011581 [Scortum barcoo]